MEIYSYVYISLLHQIRTFLIVIINYNIFVIYTDTLSVLIGIVLERSIQMRLKTS